MTWLQRNDKLLTALVLAIGIGFMIYVFFYQKAHLTANLTEIDAVFEGGNYYLYMKLKPE